MPQLDKLSFIPQVFWLIIFFLSLYILVVEVILPRIHTIFQVRALKGLMHNARISALTEEKATNKVFSILFNKLFKNTDIFVDYLNNFNKINPKTYGDDFYNALKTLRFTSALEIETAFYEMQIKKQITQTLIKK